MEQRAVARARKHANSTPAPDFVQGELVLLTKPFYEKGTGYILPQCDGPYTITKVIDTHNVMLEDILTGEAYLNGRPISVTRLIRFDFPPEYATPQPDELPAEVHSNLKIGDMIAVEYKAFASSRPQINVARVDKIFPHNDQVEVTLFQIPLMDRYGPWDRRKWVVWSVDNVPKREVFSLSEVLMQVDLDGDGSLSAASLEKLATSGVAVSTFGRDKALLARSLL